MNWTQYWSAVLAKKGGKLKDQVTMSKEQFEKMQKQAFEIGEKHGKEQSGGTDFSSIFGDAFNKK